MSISFGFLNNRAGFFAVASADLRFLATNRHAETINGRDGSPEIRSTMKNALSSGVLSGNGGIGQNARRITSSGRPSENVRLCGGGRSELTITTPQANVAETLPVIFLCLCAAEATTAGSS